MKNDVRRVENLFNGWTESIKYEDIWLTFYVNPLLSKERNIILIEFEKPVSISLINIYNYIKDPLRATKDIEVFLDNYLIYSGSLNDPTHNSLSSLVFSPFIKKSTKNVIPINPLE